MRDEGGACRQGAGLGRETQLDCAGNGRAPEAPPLHDTCWAKPSERSRGPPRPSTSFLRPHSVGSHWT